MKHPRIAHPLHELTTSAAELGYRMPAEWEPQSAIWLARPHNRSTWPGCFAEAEAEHAAFTAAVRRFVPVRMLGESISIASDDAWIRDYGPIFVKHRDTGALAIHDFHFNNWGGKYGDCQRDDVVPQKIALLLGLPLWVHDFVLEGGSVEVNGAGTVLTSESCLLHPGRNQGRDRAAIEAALHAALGTTRAIWLPAGIAGDDTDGHVDDLARFTSADTIAAVRAPAGHPDHDVLGRNWELLKNARDQAGQKFQLASLPAPSPIAWDFPAEDDQPGGVRPVPASYANFLIAGRAVFVPTFDQPTDDQALRLLEQLFPGQQVIPVGAKHLVVGLGSLHCLSQQQPV